MYISFLSSLLDLLLKRLPNMELKTISEMAANHIELLFSFLKK